ncbi:MAG: hypothetical protein IBX55_22510 [Methyloprofundus sp.]|nr:hypothetical protein [Methyloprofundus sp.]
MTEISYLRAINSWQQENGRMFLHIVLLIDGKVLDMLQKNKQYDYCNSFLADELSSWGLSDAEERLSVFSYHRVKCT